MLNRRMPAGFQTIALIACSLTGLSFQSISVAQTVEAYDLNSPPVIQGRFFAYCAAVFDLSAEAGEQLGFMNESEAR